MIASSLENTPKKFAPKFAFYNEENLKLQITAKVNKCKDRYNFVGVLQDAKDGYDKFDILKAPAINNYVSVDFEHPDWQHRAGVYTTDYRGKIETARFFCRNIMTGVFARELAIKTMDTSALDIPEEIF